jgi:hypothetical protein
MATHKLDWVGTDVCQRLTERGVPLCFTAAVWQVSLRAGHWPNGAGKFAFFALLSGSVQDWAEAKEAHYGAH